MMSYYNQTSKSTVVIQPTKAATILDWGSPSALLSKQAGPSCLSAVIFLIQDIRGHHNMKHNGIQHFDTQHCRRNCDTQH